jgi:hypothetical protein
MMSGRSKVINGVVALAGDGQFVGESEWREIASLP